MSNLSQFFSGNGVLQQVPIVADATFTCPVAGNYLVTAIGGGGGGSGGASGRGGGGGGFSQKKVALSAGATITCVIGAAGTAGNGTTAGGNGGNTTATATGLALTANGGAGGSLAGGTTAGGTASGGTVNRTGGSVSNVAAGAVDVYGNLAILNAVWNQANTGQSVSGLGSIANVASAGVGATVAGRLLCPAGKSTGEPGVGTSSAGGMFAGGGQNGGAGAEGGLFGGGGGGTTSATCGAGGRGVVIIEWVA